MKKQFQYLDSIAKNNIIEWGLGDWMEVGSVRPVRTPVPQTSTCAFYYFAEILSKTAHLMDKPREAHEFAQKAKQIRTAYNKQFLNAETGEYAKGSQTSQLISLIFGLAPPDHRELILKAFADRIEKDKRHLTTGFIGTPLLLTGLCDLGRADLAWSIATQTDYPSFIDAILNRGQTVMKEDWNGGLVQMPSLQGPIGTWFFHGLAGIRTDTDRAGFKHVILKPEITGNLTWVKARHETLFGPVESNWQHTNGKFTWQIRIPPNVTASVYVPAEDLDSITESGKALGDVRELKVTERGAGYVKLAVQSGRYEFTSAVD